MSKFTSKKLKLMTTSALVLVILFTVAIMASAVTWTASDPGYDIEYARSCEGILPEFVEGNSPNSLTGFMDFKQNYNEDDFIFSGDEPLRFDFYPDDEDLSKVFSVWLFADDDGVIYIHHWEATNLVVYHVLVTGGSNFFAYNYDGSLMEDCNLYAPKVGVNDQNVADISHFTIFYTNVPEETTTEVVETTTAAEETVVLTQPTVPLATEQTIVLTQETVPLATEPTTTVKETTNETIVVTTQDIPQTGQIGDGQSVLIGLILLGLAGSMGLLLRKVRKNEQ